MNTPIDPKEQDNRPQINEQRRRLTKGGLAAPVVISTLFSQQVLGAAPPYNCTISGKLSGGSTHGQEQPCSSLGKSPGYWGNRGGANITQWAPVLPGALFNTVFADAYPGLTLLQVIQAGGGMDASPFPALGRAAVASYLNAFKFGLDFPLTTGQVKDMFDAVYAGGTYEVKTGVYWEAKCVLCYFESLYQPTSDEELYCKGNCPGL